MDCDCWVNLQLTNSLTCLAWGKANGGCTPRGPVERTLEMASAGGERRQIREKP